VLPGLESPALTPLPATTPFRSAPVPRPSGGRGQTAPLPSVLEARARDIPSAAAGRGGLPCSLHVPTAPLVSKSALFYSIEGSNNHLIDAEVAALLEKGAIEEVELHPPLLGYISNIFLVQKKNGKMRPVINLKKLNAAHLDTPHFRMETPHDVRQTIRPGDWAASIDLKDA
jgi:hypothetical protein